MKKRILSIIAMLLALLLATPASAQPLFSGGEGYTACIGENNYLYLTDPAGVTKVLQSPIGSLDGMRGEYLYCTAADGRQYEVKLDGTTSSLIAQAQTFTQPYTLQEGVLIPRSAAGVELSGIPNVTAACASPNALYYATPNGMGGHALMILPLPLAETDVPKPEVLAGSVSKPLSMVASPDAVTIVSENDNVETVALTGVVTHFSFPGSGVTHAYAWNGKLVCLSRGEEGRYTVLSSQEHILSDPALVSVTPVPTAPVPLRATPVPTPTVTVKPTAKPAVQEDDGRISRGDTGYDVRKMQRRLLELGYPVGAVDGDFGENTLLAVNLFQCAIGYRNRSYASESMLSKLYSKKAPVYDPYAPLKEGDEGADVKILQTFLHDLGYDVGEKGVDGKFGKDTRAAVEQFQFVAALEVTGEADAETLKLLYDEEKPIPNVTPVPPTQTPASPSDL